MQGCATNLLDPWYAGIPMEDVETKKNIKAYIMTFLTMSWRKKAWWQVKSFEDIVGGMVKKSSWIGKIWVELNKMRNA